MRRVLLHERPTARQQREKRGSPLQRIETWIDYQARQRSDPARSNRLTRRQSKRLVAVAKRETDVSPDPSPQTASHPVSLRLGASSSRCQRYLPLTVPGFDAGSICTLSGTPPLPEIAWPGGSRRALAEGDPALRPPGRAESAGLQAFGHVHSALHEGLLGGR